MNLSITQFYFLLLRIFQLNSCGKKEEEGKLRLYVTQIRHSHVIQD